ncbi:MAG: T9SS type A sorting domain-containing protein [Bacteroidota bacterium]
MKQLYPYLLTILIVASTSPFSLACSCWGEPQFMLTGATMEVIVCVEKRSDVHHGMRVKVLDVLKGQVSGDNLTVWGDPGHFCRPYAKGFKVGKRYIMALSVTGGYYENEQAGDYEISVCGQHWLEIDGNKVKGPIDGEKESMNLDEFKALFPGGAIQTITVALVGDRKLRFRIPGMSFTDGTYALFNMAGQEVRGEAIKPKDPVEEIWEVSYAGLAEGMYVVRVIQGNRMYHTKILVQ